MTRIAAEERIIVALDCDGDTARKLARELHGNAHWLKVGMTLLYQEGPEIVREFHDMGFKVFVDLKLHDIPHQVQGAAASLAQIGADMMTLHASGGLAMMQGAVDAVSAFENKPIVVAVTVLTSTDDQMLRDIGVERSMFEQVISLAQLSKKAGCNGVVCSPREANLLRGQLGEDAVIVCPGIRPENAAKDDQNRVATPRAALAAGATYLVIGRPITKAPNPLKAWQEIVNEIAGA